MNGRTHTWTCITTLVGALVVAPIAVTGCLDRVPQPQPPVDTTPPRFQVLAPADSVYDLDGDVLVDLHIQWTDSGGAVDGAGVRVRSLSGVNGSADSGTNLLDVWRVERRDAVGLLAHETLEHLLHGGTNRLEITVPDTTGNVSIDTVEFELPFAAFLKSILIGSAANGVALCGDDRRVYVVGWESVAIIDADSLRLLAVVPGPVQEMQKATCRPGDPHLYVTGWRVGRFNRVTMQWLADFQPSYGSYSVTWSRTDSNLLYVGESLVASVGLYDLATATRTGSIPLPPFPQPQSYHVVYEMALLPNDEKLYAARFSEDGVIVADPGSRQFLRRIPLGPALGSPDTGKAYDVVLTRDARRILAATTFPFAFVFNGVVVIDPVRDTAVSIFYLLDGVNQDRPYALALSPSGTRLFATTVDNEVTLAARPSYLLDAESGRVLAVLPRPRIQGTIFPEQDVAFDLSGRLIYVTHGNSLYVYIHRE